MCGTINAQTRDSIVAVISLLCDMALSIDTIGRKLILYNTKWKFIVALIKGGTWMGPPRYVNSVSQRYTDRKINVARIQLQKHLSASQTI
jgi:hypothetical protein